MPGYIRGFVEWTFADSWELVCRVDPFTGSQGGFKYVLLGTGFASALVPVVPANGFPDDLAPATKLAMLGRHRGALVDLSNADLHERFRTFREETSDRPAPRHAALDDLLAFDWDSGVSDEHRSRLVDDTPGVPLLDQLRVFELVDDDGTAYAEWGSEESWRRRVADRGDAEALVRGERVEFEGRTVTLRARSRRDLVPDRWFDLLNLLDAARGHRDVRLTFYWHH